MEISWNDQHVDMSCLDMLTYELWLMIRSFIWYNEWLLIKSFHNHRFKKVNVEKATYRAYSLLHLGHICNFQNGINVHLLCCMILIEISYSLVLAIMMKNKKNTTHWEQFLSSIQNTEVKMNTLTQIYTCAFVYSPILVQSLQKIYSGIKLAIRVHISLHSSEIIH
jgi:hypothetical protein